MAEEFNSDFSKICIIGAGFSGLCAAIKCKEKLGLKNFTVYESNSDVGGVWFANTYPGCACDVQSHLYSYSFAPKSNWSRQYATQPEILEYLKSVTRKFDIYKYIKFRYQVKKLVWHEKLMKWSVLVFNIETRCESEIFYDIVINGCGNLRKPRIPAIFDSFQRIKFHSAEWDHTVDLNGKTVAVVGTGASAVQIIPDIVGRVGKLLSYQREPGWVFPKLDFEYSKFSKWAFSHIPGWRLAYRSMLLHVHDSALLGFETGTVLGRFCYNSFSIIASIFLRLQTKKKFQISILPNLPILCRPATFSNKYYPALQLPNVKVIRSRIVGTKESSILTEDGHEEIIDVLILATGFQSEEYFAPMEIIGEGSQDILSKWTENNPSVYLGLTTCDMPNYFTILGPGAGSPHTTNISKIECQVHLMIEILKEMKKRNAKFVSVKRETESSYVEEMKKVAGKLVFEDDRCANSNSWFINTKGVITVYPKRNLNFWRKTRKVNPQKFDFM